MKVKLKQDYSVAGKRYQAGAVLEVNEHTGSWLIGEGIAVRSSGRNKSKPDKKQQTDVNHADE